MFLQVLLAVMAVPMSAIEVVQLDWERSVDERGPGGGFYHVPGSYRGVPFNHSFGLTGDKFWEQVSVDRQVYRLTHDN